MIAIFVLARRWRNCSYYRGKALRFLNLLLSFLLDSLGERIFLCSSGLTLNTWCPCFIFSVKATLHYQILPLFWFIMEQFCFFLKKIYFYFFLNHFCHSLFNFSRIVFFLQIIGMIAGSKRRPKNINLFFFILWIQVLWFWLLFYFENRMHIHFILQVLSIEYPNSRC